MTFTELKAEWTKMEVRRQDMAVHRPVADTLVNDSSALRAMVGLILEKLAEQEEKNTCTVTN